MQHNGTFAEAGNDILEYQVWECPVLTANAITPAQISRKSASVASLSILPLPITIHLIDFGGGRAV